MAPREIMTRYAFLAVLALSVFLIAVIVGNGIFDDDLARPGYYRDTAPSNEAFYLTRTAEAANSALGTSAPENTHEGRGRGGNNPENHDRTPTPTIDWDAIEDDQ